LILGVSLLVTDPHGDDALARRIAVARAAEASKRDGSKREESQGWSIAVEFIGAMLVGGLIGWFIDRQVGSKPWGLIVMLLLGFATGLRSVLRQQKKFDGE
jgi:ATP synthase protein I